MTTGSRPLSASRKATLPTARERARAKKPTPNPTPDEHTNPLRVGTRLERIPEPCVMVVFGATGDLAHL